MLKKRVKWLIKKGIRAGMIEKFLPREIMRAVDDARNGRYLDQDGFMKDQNDERDLNE